MTDVEKSNELAQIESAAAPQGMRYVHIDESVQKRVKRKLDMNLMPLVVALCKLPNPPKTPWPNYPADTLPLSMIDECSLHCFQPYLSASARLSS